MTYTVTYRDKSGAKTEIEIKAADRAECVAECKARGIAPMAIREGRSRGTRCQDTHDHRNAKERRGIRVLLGIVGGLGILALGAWWLLARPKADLSHGELPSGAKQKAEKNIKDVNIPKGRKTLRETPPAPAARRPVATTNVTEIVPQQAVSDVASNVASKVEEPEGGIQYRTCTEQILGWIFSCPLGNSPMPLPNLPPKELEHLEEILATPNLPKETDDDFVKEQKEIIQQAKIEFRKYLDEGGKPGDFLNYYHDLLINYHDQFVDAQKSVLKVVREEDPEFARQYLLKVNAQLAEKGIKPVTLSRKFSERIGIEYKGKEKK